VKLQDTVVKNLNELLLVVKQGGNYMSDLNAAVTIVDKDFNILYGNAKARKLAEAAYNKICREAVSAKEKPPEFIFEGEKCYKVYRGSETICPGCLTKKVFDEKESLGGFKTHNELIRRYLDINSYLVLDENKEVLGVVEVALDITGNLLASGEIHNAKNCLQDIIFPLNMAQQSQLEPEELNEQINLMFESGERAAYLLAAVHSRLRRPEKGTDFTKGPVDLIDTLERVVKRFKPKYYKQKVELELDIRIDTSAHCEGNISDIEGVFENLLLNALEACMHVKGRSTKETITAFHQDGYYHIVFEDNGPGIPEDILKNIWSPYFSTKESTRKREERGLGLSMVRKIIEEDQCGEAHVESPEGARFTLKIPNPTTLKKLRKDSREE